MKPTPRPFRLLVACCAFAAPSGCVEVQQVAPGADSLLPSVRESAVAAAEDAPFTGLRLENRLAGSLIDLEFAPGLEVAEVVAGSPAEAAGLRVGDRVVRANGATLETVEQFEALLAQASGDALRLEVERDGGVGEVVLEPRRAAAARAWEPSRFAERLKGRFVAATVAPAQDGGSPGGARIVELLARSPLADAGIRPGDVVVAIDERKIADARDLAQEFAKREFGAEFELALGGDEPRTVEIRTWSPPRRLTALSVPILFRFERDFGADEVEFELLDLYLLKLYGYYREGSTRRHELLWFTIVETGVGVIAEEPEEAKESE